MKYMNDDSSEKINFVKEILDNGVYKIYIIDIRDMCVST